MPKPLSPAAKAVLSAITQQQYSLDPDDIPKEAGRMACIAASALRAAATQLRHDPNQSHQVSGIIASRWRLICIAAELEGEWW